MTSKIASLHATEILDSRGNPTLRVRVQLDDGRSGTASVPSGASTGEHEALELRDGDMGRYRGKGVLRALANVTGIIAPNIIGMDPFRQAEIDDLMIDLDGTEDKSKFGANAILGVSMAVARAASGAAGLPLYAYLGGPGPRRLPVPMMNVINGGVHAEFIQRGIAEGTTNAVLIKLNQIGTVTETIKAINLCRQAGWRFIISHRSGETEDTFIADFAVGMGGGQIKTGSLSRSERVAKYNRLIEIDQDLGAAGVYRNPFGSELAQS